MASYGPTLITSYTIPAGGTTTITLSSIPQTYTDLIVYTSLRSDRGTDFDYPQLRFNGATSNTNLSKRDVDSNYSGGTVVSSSDASVSWVVKANTYGYFSNDRVYISDYASSNVKTITVENACEFNSNTAAYIAIVGGLWNSTAAITSVVIGNAYGQKWVEDSVIYLYGVKPA